jgi:hypothetical protein
MFDSGKKDFYYQKDVEGEVKVYTVDQLDYYCFRKKLFFKIIDELGKIDINRNSLIIECVN